MPRKTDKQRRIDNNIAYVAECNATIKALDTQIKQKETELATFIDEKSREIGLTQLKEQRENIDNTMKEKCMHTNSYIVRRISLGYGEFSDQYHCRECNDTWND